MHFLKDTLRESVEAATGGKVTVLYDDKGYPSYMNVIVSFMGQPRQIKSMQGRKWKLKTNILKTTMM